MTPTTLGSFLRPEGFDPLRPSAMLRELNVVAEAGRLVARRTGDRVRGGRRVVRPVPTRDLEPVILVPGFLAGDGSLALVAGALRATGVRTYRSMIHANVGCTQDAVRQLEGRLESVAARRESPVRLVGHSLGGMLARSVAAKRPDLVSGVVTLGSPMLAPGAHHPTLTATVELLVRLSRAGLQGLMAEDCVAGDCARTAFELCRAPLAPHIDFTAVWSRRDGVVDHRACVPPEARSVEVTASHLGMVVDPRVIDLVVESVRGARRGATPVTDGAAAEVTASVTPLRSVIEVDRGEIA